MPTVWREGPFRFFFYSEERNEPPHIHVEIGDPPTDIYAKMWLGPPVAVAVAFWRNFSARDRRAAREIVIRQRTMMEQAWHDHFGT